jgi:trimeric autotransporter adhesin
MKHSVRALIACAGWLLGPPIIVGQIVLTGSSYFQDFNNLAGGLPDGWGVYSNSTATTLGTVETFTTAATTWAGSTSGTSFRNISSNTISTTATAAVQAANTDRAFGLRPQSAGTRDGSVVLALADTAGFENFALSVDLFTGNNSGSTNQTYNIEYRVGASGSFIVLGTYETTTPFGSISFTTGSSSLPALNDQLNPVYFRFYNASGVYDSSYDTLGIDNFSLSYSTVPEPSTYAAIAGALALGAAAWCRRRRGVKSDGANTARSPRGSGFQPISDTRITVRAD